MRLRRIVVPALAIALTASACTQAPSGEAALPGGLADGPGAIEELLGDPYRGFGAWIDVFDPHLWREPEEAVAALAERGVRTLYLQTTSHRFPRPIRYPAATGRFLDAAHAHGMRVVAWYVPAFRNLRRDLARALAAAAFVAPSGARFESVAVDIEVTEVEDPSLRARRMVTLSRRLRAAVGPDYPLGAIVPSPLRGPDFWPVLPIDRLATIYDAILPMAYWTFHANGEDEAYGYISRSIELLRDEGGDDLAIHVIGGIARPATPAELRGFVRAVREAGVIGASVYDVATTDARAWAILGDLR